MRPTLFVFRCSCLQLRFKHSFNQKIPLYVRAKLRDQRKKLYTVEPNQTGSITISLYNDDWFQTKYVGFKSNEAINKINCLMFQFKRTQFIAEQKLVLVRGYLLPAVTYILTAQL